MDLKHLIALLSIVIAIPAATVFACIFRRARDAAFFLMIFGCVWAERISVNFDTHYWYRGTTRGFEFSAIDILAAALLISSLLKPGKNRLYWPAGFGVMLLFFFYCSFSVVIADPKLFGLFELSKILRSILVFLAAAMFLRGKRELSILVLALCCAVCFEGALSIRQRFIIRMPRVAGNLDHANSLSMYLCTVSPILAAAALSDLPKRLRQFSWVSLGIAAGTILMTVSRAGIPIFAIVILGTLLWCSTLQITFRKIAGFIGICLLTGILFYLSLDTLKTRFTAASVEGESSAENFESRAFYLWIAHGILSEHFWGVGLNNWSWQVSSEYGPRLGIPYRGYPGVDEDLDRTQINRFVFAPPAHNLAVLTAGELGWPGLLLFALVWLRWFHMGAAFLWRRSTDAMRRLGVGFFFSICGIFLQSLTEWVYHQTQILLTFHIILGSLASLYRVKHHAAVLPAEPAEVEEPILTSPIPG